MDNPSFSGGGLRPQTFTVTTLVTGRNTCTGKGLLRIGFGSAYGYKDLEEVVVFSLLIWRNYYAKKQNHQQKPQKTLKCVQ